MMILLLAAAMTVAMLIATIFGIQEETRRLRISKLDKSTRGFGYSA